MNKKHIGSTIKTLFARLGDEELDPVLAENFVETITEKYRAFVKATTRLPDNQIRNVLLTEHPENYCIAATLDKGKNELVLFLGNFEKFVVPLYHFTEDSRNKPDFDDFEIINQGLTLRFGSYQESVRLALSYNENQYT